METAVFSGRGYIEVIRGDWRKGRANRYRFKLADGALQVEDGSGESSSTSSILSMPR